MWNVSSDYWNWQAIWNLEFCFLFHSQFIMLPWAEYLFLWAKHAASFICCLTHRRHSAWTCAPGSTLVPDLCKKKIHRSCLWLCCLCWNLWCGDECDIMAYAILLKLCSTEDTAHMMESGIFYGMKFTMGLIKRHSCQENLCGALR